MRAILVSVDYSDLLAVTLPYNRHHFDSVLVVTSPTDVASARVARDNDCSIFTTDAFYRDGAVFNKWLALEEGLGIFGRVGWLCIMDADVLWPKAIPDYPREIGTLYTPLRRMLEKPSQLATLYHEGPPPESMWHIFPVHRNVAEFAGYSQIFHASDPHLPPAPWHETDWKHAGGADSFFQMRWPPECKVRPPFHCLHIGPAGTNWCGRVSPLLDGTVLPEAPNRSRQLRELVAGRARRQGDRFAGERLKQP